VSKDRARPFSRKHRRYWITVTGGMLLIGFINVLLGFLSYDPPTGEPEKIELVLPKLDGGLVDAPVMDAATRSN